MDEADLVWIQELYQKHFDTVYRICLSHAHSGRERETLAEDCAQQAFVDAILQIDKLRSYDNPIGWIVCAAMSHLRNEESKGWRRRRILKERMYLPIKPSAENDPQRQLASKETRAAVEQFYCSLSDADRAVFRAYFLDDKHVREISMEMGLTQDSISSRIKRIRQHARKNKTDLILWVFCVRLSLYTTYIIRKILHSSPHS